MISHKLFDNDHVKIYCDGQRHNTFFDMHGLNVLGYTEECHCDPLERFRRDQSISATIDIGELEDMAYIAHLKQDIAYFERRYHQRNNEKSFHLADLIYEVIQLLNKVLEGYQNEFTAKYGGSQVSQTQSSGSQTVFVLKR